MKAIQIFYSLSRAFVLVTCAAGAVSAQEPKNAWLDVPFVEQERNGCGSASIAMVMQYWMNQEGRPSTDASDAKHIHRKLYVPGTDGIYASDMGAYFQEHGFRAFAFRGDLELLRLHLQKGRPLIAALKPSDGPLHYVVVTGLDPGQKVILLNDPARRKLIKEDGSSFEKQWSAAGNWTMLAVPQPKDSE